MPCHTHWEITTRTAVMAHPHRQFHTQFHTYWGHTAPNEYMSPPLTANNIPYAIPCTWCVHANVHWSGCPMFSCKRGVSRVTERCMDMCSEPSVRLTAHLLPHVRYSGHCTFTCTWCVHVNVQWSDSLMCSIIGKWAQWLTRQSLGSLHVYMHLMCDCKCAVNRLSDVFI